jgi:integrase
MAKIVKRTRKDGQFSYKVEIRLSGHHLTKTFRTKKEALSWETSTEASIREGRHSSATVGSLKTFREAVVQFRQSPPVRNGSWLVRKSSGHFLNFWVERLGSLKIGEIQASHIAACRKILREKGVSPATCNRYTSAISTILQCCVDEWFYLNRNPARELRRFPESGGRCRVLDGNERSALLEACKSQQDLYDFVLLALNTGARRGELRDLLWKNVDLKASMVTFPDTKNGTDRTIPLTEVAVELLRERFLNRQLGKGDWVFPAPRSAGPADFRKLFAKALAQSEIEDFRFHDLRHTVASHLVIQGVAERMIAEILGHKTLQMVKRYTHLRPEHLREAIQTLNRRISKA